MRVKLSNFSFLSLISPLGPTMLFSTAICFFSAGCSSHPIKPDSSYVKVTRDNPKSDCELIGPVQGSVATVRGTFEDALEDMKLDAARKGANFVQIQSTSAYGTSTSGTAYKCP